jgi:uncharacterized protein (UPF0332 family)
MGQAGARSAVSRAYYGAFHIAQDLLFELATVSRGAGAGKSHTLVPQYLRESQHPDAKQAASLLSDLHSDRIKADYRLGDANVETIGFAKLNVEAAKQIQQRLASFRIACKSDPDVLVALRAGVKKVQAAHRGGV